MTAAEYASHRTSDDHRRATRLRHEPDTFVVAHRLQIDRSRTGQLSDGDNSRFRDHFSLEPVAPTGARVPQIMQEH